MTLKVAALTQGINEPSARFRWRQYSSFWADEGVFVEEYISRFGAYAPKEKWNRPIWGAVSLFDCAKRVVDANSFGDLCFLQRNLIATLYTFERYIKKPIVFDVDDAIFLNDRWRASEKIAKRSSLVICGNTFLANHYEKYANVKIVPTGVDTERFYFKQDEGVSQFYIGWSGSSSGFSYLYDIEDSLNTVLQLREHVKLLIVSDREPVFKKIDKSKVNFIKWSSESEVCDLHKFKIGIMPLKDDLWSRGKCSFKMLTYMSAGIPVVVSPIGMNVEVLNKPDSGLFADSIVEWVDCLLELIDNKELRRKYALNARLLIENKYSSKIVSGKLLNIFKEFK